MFHQVRLLPDDFILLRFLWRDLKVDKPPRIFEWQVLPFGTTCSPCCVTFALQQHVLQHSGPDDTLRFSVENCFYVDNCLQSVPTTATAKLLGGKLLILLTSAGFQLRQWACNDPTVLSHLHLSFILARSRVAPKHMHSVACLELCAPLVAVQLASVLERELTLKVARTVLWSDSTTVQTLVALPFLPQ